MVQKQKTPQILILVFGFWIVHNFLNPYTNNQNSSAFKCSIVNITVTELTQAKNQIFSHASAESTTTWEEWVVTQAKLALTSSMANLNHTVWKLRETFVLNPKNEKKREKKRVFIYNVGVGNLTMW